MARYTLGPAGSRFTVQAFASGMLSALGHSPTFEIRDFAGELRFAPDAVGEAAFHMTVKAESLTLKDSVSAKDRAGKDADTMKTSGSAAMQGRSRCFTAGL